MVEELTTYKYWLLFGCFTAVSVKMAVSLWKGYREKEPDGKGWVWWKEMIDFFLRSKEATMTTLLTIVVGWILASIWAEEMVNFLSDKIDMIPKHASTSFLLGLLSESLVAPVSKRISKLIVG